MEVAPAREIKMRKREKLIFLSYFLVQDLMNFICLCNDFILIKLEHALILSSALLAYRNCMKEQPGLNEHLLRMNAPLHS